MSKSPDELVLLAFQTPRTGRAAHSIQYSEDVVNRAKELGIVDKEYYWIAEESLRAPLEAEWIQCYTDEGYAYYWNSVTEVSSWEHPGLDYYKQLYASSVSKKVDMIVDKPQGELRKSKEAWNPLSDRKGVDTEPVASKPRCEPSTRSGKVRTCSNHVYSFFKYEKSKIC